jgi:NAD-dependent dihydropyrimidine dehydrogenase PreA subunit
MVQDKVYITPNVPTPGRPVIFNPDICTGCNECVEACQVDVFVPNPEAGMPPIILHPEECWYGGCCVAHCPSPGAIEFNWPLMQRVQWKRKDTGEIFRV